MKISELREMSDEQLAVTLREANEGLFRLRVRAQTERVGTPTEAKKTRQLIARVKTLQTERGRSASAASAASTQAGKG